MNFQTIQTSRLELKLFNQEVANYVYNHFDDEELMHFIGVSTQEELQKNKKRFQGGLSTFNKTFEYFFIEDKATKRVIGWCGFHTWYVDHDRAELGYWIFDEDFRRKGIMTETLTAILDHGFSKMNLHRVEAFVGSKNEASLATLAHFGFTQEAVAREHYKVDGVNEDSLFFALLKHEYQAV